MNGTRIVALASLLTLTAAPVFAQNSWGLYVGAGLGDFSSDGIDDIDDADFDLDDDALKLFAGWRFTPFLAAQLDYTDFGEVTGGPPALELRAQARGLTPNIVATLPLGLFEVFAKAGVIFYEVEVDSAFGSIVDESDSDMVYGVGVGLNLLDRLNLNAEYERIEIEELDDADALWITAAWDF